MESNSRIQTSHLRQPDLFGSGIRPASGAFPPYDRLHPMEVAEQKMDAQHKEMQKVATENRRLAATHGTLRRELAAAHHELKSLHSQIGVEKSEKELYIRGLMERMAKMETELQAAEPLGLELQKAQADARSLVAARNELISGTHKLAQDLQSAHTNLQQIPSLMSELQNLRQEYHQCSATYDHEKKVNNNHLEYLQRMESQYKTMETEIQKLQMELKNTANVDKRAGGPIGGTTGYNENEAYGYYLTGQPSYEGGYGVPQGRQPLPPDDTSGGAAAPASFGDQSVTPPAGSAYGATGGTSYDEKRGLGNDAQRGPAYNLQWRPGYDIRRGGFDAHKKLGHDAPRQI